jgi:transcriptional regulator with XRE-family HTH domain
MKSATYDFDKLFDDLENDPEYMAECAIIEFTEEVCRRMDALGVSRAELARRLGTSQAYITKLLQGNANFTLKTMVKIAMALESEYRSHLQPDGAQATWYDLVIARQANRQQPMNLVALKNNFRHPDYKAGQEADDDTVAITA